MHNRELENGLSTTSRHDPDQMKADEHKLVRDKALLQVTVITRVAHLKDEYPVQVKCQRLQQQLKIAYEAERQWTEWRAELKHVTEDATVALRTEMYLLKHANRKLKLKLLDAMHQLDQSMPIKAWSY